MTTAPCFLGEAHDPVKAGSLASTIFKVRRVEHTAATNPLKCRSHHWRLGRIDDDRRRDLGGEPLGKDIDVGHPVPPDIIDAQVDEVRSFGYLPLTDRYARIDVPFEHHFAEWSREPFALVRSPMMRIDRVLMELHGGVRSKTPMAGVRLSWLQV